jgi:hypothetical protein
MSVSGCVMRMARRCPCCIGEMVSESTYKCMSDGRFMGAKEKKSYCY